jgi:hypothetical protein
MKRLLQKNSLITLRFVMIPNEPLELGIRNSVWRLNIYIYIYMSTNSALKWNEAQCALQYYERGAVYEHFEQLARICFNVDRFSYFARMRCLNRKQHLAHEVTFPICVGLLPDSHHGH